ncbi:MAG TPA: hypothetical protein PLA81_05960 [Syntrophorhabdaceae bacterium]|jgi:cell division protein FtsL|nr:hypothetical protein [Syntrophorhabdaceae bacterium]HOS05828.1 hypothetical protein [Syntrophorhabdaceae bacterium]HPL41122.1 hypothetical protein [Syntrophorhabdaceae bacterium]
MERLYIHTKRETTYRSMLTIFLVVLFFISSTLVVFFVKGVTENLNDELVNRLMKEREVIETNNNLKMELSVAMRARYIEFKTKERLGLKKPNEEEVLVLR